MSARKLGEDSRRFRELDGFRGIAASLVVFGHFIGIYETHFVGFGKMPFEFHYGAFGVQLFFLISGYVILMSAWRSKRASDFVISRFSRLYPTYWIALTISIVLVVLTNFPTEKLSPLDYLLNYSMVQRLIRVPSVDEVYWTLAVEMQFYGLIFLLLLLTKCRLSSRLILWVSLVWVTVAVVGAFISSGVSQGVHPSQVPGIYKVFLNLLLIEWGPLFCSGMMAYLGRVKDVRFFAVSVLYSLVAVLVAYLLHSPKYAATVGVVCTVFLVVVIRGRAGVLLIPPLQFLGKISYSLYIQHVIPGFLVIIFLAPIIGDFQALLVALCVVVCLAVLLHKVGEEWASGVARTYSLRLRSKIDGLVAK
ncbi:acyltransferase family protein [Dermabacteraceae bacterium P7054]